MVFSTGYAANECNLHDIVHAFLIENGWQLVTQIDTFDKVYFSSGEDGYKDIYVRIKANLVNPYIGSQNIGARQVDLVDGYSGYLNFFAYQYFPNSTDGYAGYGEAGKFGPRAYLFVGGASDAVYYQNISTQNSSNRKWKYVGAMVDDLGFNKTSRLSYGSGCFDGVSNYYGGAASSYAFFKYDIHNDSAEHTTEFIDAQRAPSNLVWYVDKNTRKEYMYFVVQGRTGSGGHTGSTIDVGGIAGDMRRIDLDTGMIEFGFNGPSQVWDYAGGYEFEYSYLVWDSGNYMYCARNYNGTAGRKEVAKYNIGTNQWSRLPDYPVISTYRVPLLFVNRVISGAQYNRLYTVLNNSGWKMYYINLNDNGDAVGSWTSAGSLPVSYTASSSSISSNGVNRFYFIGGNSTSTLYYAKIEDTTSLTWITESSYFPLTISSTAYNDFVYMDGYASRTRASLYSNTKYWLFGNKDYMAIITRYVPYGQNIFMATEHPTAVDLQNFSYKYDCCYMGSYIPYTTISANASTTSSVSSGTNVLIPIQMNRGEFEVGQKMYISDVTGGSVLTRESATDGFSRRFMPTEQITITDVIPNVSIEADYLANNYSSGSRIAIDPQPVCITFTGTNRAQLLNHVEASPNTDGSSDMSENIVKLESAADSIIEASGYDSRNGKYSLWPISLVDEGTEAPYSGAEIRGKLIGIFAISENGLSSEDTISIGQNTYVVFDVGVNKPYYYAIGPIVTPEDE